MTAFEYNDEDFLYVQAFQQSNIDCSTLLGGTYQETDSTRYHKELCVNQKLASDWKKVHQNHSGSHRRMNDTSQKNTIDVVIMINYIVSLLFFSLYIKNIIV
jgi:hypothetical protein